MSSSGRIARHERYFFEWNSDVSNLGEAGDERHVLIKQGNTMPQTRAQHSQTGGSTLRLKPQ
jgi:hypothetical protein